MLSCYLSCELKCVVRFGGYSHHDDKKKLVLKKKAKKKKKGMREKEKTLCEKLSNFHLLSREIHQKIILLDQTRQNKSKMCSKLPEGYSDLVNETQENPSSAKKKKKC